MRAHVGILNHFEVSGFSWLESDHHDYVTVLVNGAEVATVPATRFRRDLRDAGIGDGRCSFKFVFADTPGIFQPVEIEARSKETGKPIANGKKTLPPLLDGGASYRHSLARPCVAFVPTRVARQNDRITVHARALAPADSQLTVVPLAGPEGAGASPDIEDLQIASDANADLPAGAPFFRSVSWSFDLGSCAEATVALFALRGAGLAADPLQASLSEVASTVCIPLKSDWFTVPSADNYTRTAGRIDDINQLILGATTHGYKVDAISRLMLDGARKIAVLDWGVGFGRAAMPIKRLFNPEARITGYDIDQFNVDWARANVPDIRVDQCDLYPPFPLAADSLDFIYAISVMTHLTEATQEVWLRELRRVIRPGGAVLLTTRGDHLLLEQQVRAPESLLQLAKYGISDISQDLNLGPKLENKTYYRGTIQLRQHVEQNWTRYFDIVGYLPYGFGQDAVVMRKS